MAAGVPARPFWKIINTNGAKAINKVWILSLFFTGRRTAMRMMAVDYGDVRTGVAFCDVREMLATA